MLSSFEPSTRKKIAQVVISGAAGGAAYLIVENVDAAQMLFRGLVRPVYAIPQQKHLAGMIAGGAVAAVTFFFIVPSGQMILDWLGYGPDGNAI